MGGFKNVVEPLIIVSSFTIATLVNRRPGPIYWRWWQREDPGPSERTPLLPPPSPPLPPIPSGIAHWAPYPPTRQFHNTITSRILRFLPFLIEIAYWLLAYWPYQLMRARTALWISSNPERKKAIFDMARENAKRILRVEKWLGIDIEYGVQHFVMTRCKSWVMPLLCKVYVAHITIGIMFLGYAYTYFPRPTYQRVRRTIALDNFLAFIVLSIYRCMPPRLMPTSYGFIDVLHPRPGTGVGEPSDWSNNHFQLTIAAMPSLHFGTSLVIGTAITIWGRHAPLRAVAPLYPAVMFVVVLATANHWVLDCVAGVGVVCLGWYANWVMLALRPAEECLFWVLRTEKPREEDVVTWKGIDEGEEGGE